MTKLTGVVVLLLIVLADTTSAQRPSAETRRDVLIFRASGQQAGELQGCTGASCSFSGRPYSRPEIFMLGLAVTASDAPPAIADPLQDAVYLRNAGVVKSKLVSIDARQVVTEQGSHPRANVAWVFLALATASPGPRDASPGPRGGWVGTIDWWIPTPRGRQWGRLDLTFDYDGRGNLKGRMTGDDHVETRPVGEFCGMTTQTPSKLSANLVGQYTPGRNTMSLRLADPQIEQGQFSMCAIGPGGGPLRMSGQPFGGGGPLGQPGLAQLLNSLTVKADGSVEASGEWPVAPAHEPQTTLHLKLALRRAQN